MTSEPPIEKIFISADSLLRDSMELAMNVLRSGFRPTFLVAIWRGGAPIGITVQEVLEYHGVIVDHIPIRTSSYVGIDQQAKSVRVHALDYLVSRLEEHDRLLLIDDVFDSGRSLEAVMSRVAAALSSQPARHHPDSHGLLQTGAQSHRADARLLRPVNRHLAGVSP